MAKPFSLGRARVGYSVSIPDGVVRDGKSRGEFAPFKERQYRGDVRHGGREAGRRRATLIDDFDFYVGIDLAFEKHQACVINRTGKVVGELAFEHSGAGLIDFIHSLEKLSGSLTTRVGIVLETP